MTIFGRDASHYDPDAIDFTGLSFFTHKASEGTTLPDAKYVLHMAAARAGGVPVLGSYHVLRTPGSGGAGSLVAQLSYWVARQDALTPWWRTHPYWVMQVDAERWQYDQVSPANVLAFAALLARSGLPGWKVTYASRGQYGDSLKGIATPLWNASYGKNTGAYPGDDWATGWAPYSGQTPVLLQYTSKPYDRNAFRGSLTQLQALIRGDDMEQTDKVVSPSNPKSTRGNYVGDVIADVGNERDWLYSVPGKNEQSKNPPPPGSRLDQMYQAATRPAAPAPVAMTAEDRQAIIDGVTAQLGGKLDTLLARLTAAGDALDG